MKFQTLISIPLCLAFLSSASADPSWTFKLPTQSLDAQYTVDIKAGPHIVFTKIPAKGSLESWEGLAVNAPPNLYKIVVLSFTDAWYTKPWYSTPDTIIGAGGVFKFDIITGDGNPGEASQVSISIVPKSFETPVVTGSREIPKSITTQSVFSLVLTR